jgi:hypothetical protein
MSGQHMTMRERVLSVLQGRKPDRIPFIDRLDFWYKHHVYQSTMPMEFKGFSLTEVHWAVGMGQEKWCLPYTYRYHQVEVISRLNGEVFYHEVDPEIDFFPAIWDMIPDEKIGVTETDFITPVGRLTVHHEMLPEMIVSGTRPYYKRQPVREEADYRIFEYIIEHAEFVPRYDEFFREEARLGEHAYLVPNIERIPFQSLLLDVVGEKQFFYALYDFPQAIERLLNVLDLQVTDKLHHLADFPVPLVEFVDNLDGFMTNPRLFEKYSKSTYQKYAEILNSQNKKVASHTDGNLKPLVNLLPECGLDVCESFTPSPITQLSFEEAWRAWQNGPLIWGGIPSLYLEARISEVEFREYIDHLFDLIGERPIILGIGDAVMSDNLIERVAYIAKKVQNL